MKKCSGICGLELELNKENFEPRKDSKDGFRAQCKYCRNKGRGILKHIIIENNVHYQICTGECRRKLKICKENFGWEDKNKKLYCRKCKDCIKEYKLSYFQKNKNNLLEKANERYKKRIKNDAAYRFMKYASSKIKKTLKSQNSSKNRIKIKDVLNFIANEWILIRDFYFALPGNNWMTEYNQGSYKNKTWNDNDPLTWKWSLDHIIPQDDLKFDSFSHTNFNICWNLFNLRPYSAKQNILDGNRLKEEIKTILKNNPIFQGNNFKNYLISQNIPKDQIKSLLKRMKEFVKIAKQIIKNL